MTIPPADRAMLDTNILLTATDAARSGHREATDLLDLWPRAGSVLYGSGQILREYYAVATRPVKVNGLGLSRADALSNLDVFSGRLTIVDEDARVHDRLRSVLDAVPCTGKVVHDANIVATMLVHGVGTILTRNVDDFDRFADMIRVQDLVLAP